MATSVEVVTTLLTVAAWSTCCSRCWARATLSTIAAGLAAASSGRPRYAPDVSILKPLKGVDDRMYAGFVSHCLQQYAGNFEILFGVSSLEDPAVARIERLCAEFPECSIR